MALPGSIDRFSISGGSFRRVSNYGTIRARAKGNAIVRAIHILTRSELSRVYSVQWLG